MDNTITFRLISAKGTSEFQDVELDNLSVSEANAFKNVLDSFIALSKMYDDEQAIIKIKRGSAQAEYQPSTETTYLKIVKDMDDVIQNKSIKKPLIDEYNKILNVCSNENFQLTLERTNGNSKIVNLNQYFKREKPFYKKRSKRSSPKIEIAFLSGELFDLGGKNINAHITSRKGEVIVIDLERKSDAKKLSNYLYANAHICAYKYKTQTSTRWKYVDNYIDVTESEKFQLFYNQILQLELVERYEKIYEFVFETLEKTDDLEFKLRLIVRHLRMFVSEKSDKGMLMTILLALSQFKDNIVVLDFYRRTNDIYKRKSI